jgi:hypothetical protein
LNEKRRFNLFNGVLIVPVDPALLMEILLVVEGNKLGVIDRFSPITVVVDDLDVVGERKRGHHNTDRTYDVYHDIHPPIVECGDKIMEVLFGAEVRAQRVVVLGPVTCGRSGVDQMQEQSRYHGMPRR